MDTAGSDTLIAGRYRLVNRLASGGMGSVWEGWDERLRRPVAVKQLHLQPGLRAADADAATNRALREARITARLHHPHAVPVFDVVDEGGRPCLIMQYLPSISLQQLVGEKGVLESAEVARIGGEIASALVAAHEAGIVHRDVKPGNVLIAEDGTAKITDFGISHALDDVTVTSTGMITGTPAYLAPEVARGQASGFAADVYSLGATLYLALEGVPPFGIDDNPMATLHRVTSQPPRPPQRSGPLTAAVMQMLAADPRERPQMRDVAARLGQLAAAAPRASETTAVLASAPPPTATLPAVVGPPPRADAPPPMPPRPEPVGRPVGRPGRRRNLRALVLLGAALLTALAVVLGVTLIGRSGTGSPGSGSGTAPASASRSAPQPTSASASASASAAKPAPAPPPAGNSGPGNGGGSGSGGGSGNRGGPGNGNSTGGSAQLVGALTDYYGLLPGDTSAAWPRLTAQYQQSHAGGRQSYERFWNAIDRVQVSNATRTRSAGVEATISYFYKDGRVVDEDTTFTLVRGDTGWLIADSAVRRSTTR